MNEIHNNTEIFLMYAFEKLFQFEFFVRSLQYNQADEY